MTIGSFLLIYSLEESWIVVSLLDFCEESYVKIKTIVKSCDPSQKAKMSRVLSQEDT